MMKRTRKMVLAIITALGIGAMATSYATGMGMGPGEGCAMAGKKMANPAQIDSKLVEMKKILKIGSAQEEAWTTFATIMKRQKTEMMSAMQEEKMQQRTSKEHPAQAAPDRIDERIQFMKQRVASMETAAAAMKQLYAILTPQQREILNERSGQNLPI
jgi:Spy/CpxP family protein refolding chaperone